MLVIPRADASIAQSFSACWNTLQLHQISPFQKNEETTVIQITTIKYSYSRYMYVTGISLQWRFTRGNIIKKRLIKNSPHKPQLQASSSPLPRIRLRFIVNLN